MRSVIGCAALALLLAAGCSWSVGSKQVPPGCPPASFQNPASPARDHSSLITAANTLPHGDRVELLKALAANPYLSNADRELLIKTANTLPHSDRVAVLGILAKGN